LLLKSGLDRLGWVRFEILLFDIFFRSKAVVRAGVAIKVWDRVAVGVKIVVRGWVRVSNKVLFIVRVQVEVGV